MTRQALVAVSILLVAACSGRDVPVSGDGGLQKGCPQQLPVGQTCQGDLTCEYELGHCGMYAYECRCQEGRWLCIATEACMLDQGIDISPDGQALSAEGGGSPPGKCPACKPDEICVQSFDGTCNAFGPHCTKVSAICKQKVGTPGSMCAPECEKEYCGGGPFQCQIQVPCGSEAPGVRVYCYGP